MTTSERAAPRALSLAAFATLLLIALLMGANHVAARVAFDHGVDVATAVAVRSCVTDVLREVTESYEKLGAANSPDGATFFWTEEEFDLAVELAAKLLVALAADAEELDLFALVDQRQRAFAG